MASHHSIKTIIKQRHKKIVKKLNEKRKIWILSSVQDFDECHRNGREIYSETTVYNNKSVANRGKQQLKREFLEEQINAGKVFKGHVPKDLQPCFQWDKDYATGITENIETKMIENAFDKLLFTDIFTFVLNITLYATRVKLK